MRPKLKYYLIGYSATLVSMLLISIGIRTNYLWVAVIGAFIVGWFIGDWIQLMIKKNNP